MAKQRSSTTKETKKPETQGHRKPRRGLTEEEKQERAAGELLRVVCGVKSGSKDKPAVEEDRRLDLAKVTSGEVRRVVEWLLKADYRTKLAVILSHVLLTHEDEIKESGGYKGDIGNDLLSTWDKEVNNDQDKAGAQDIWISGYACGLDY